MVLSDGGSCDLSSRIVKRELTRSRSSSAVNSSHTRRQIFHLPVVFFFVKCKIKIVEASAVALTGMLGSDERKKYSDTLIIEANGRKSDRTYTVSKSVVFHFGKRCNSDRNTPLHGERIFFSSPSWSGSQPGR